jgi:hypothetical protein
MGGPDCQIRLGSLQRDKLCPLRYKPELTGEQPDDGLIGNLQRPLDRTTSTAILSTFCFLVQRTDRIESGEDLLHKLQGDSVCSGS